MREFVALDSGSRMKSLLKRLLLAAAMLSGGLVAAEEPAGVAPSEASGTCNGIVTDETEPALRELLESSDVEVQQVGETKTVQVSKEKQVSTSYFKWRTRGASMNALWDDGRVECTLECAGQWCGGQGCQASGTSCSSFSCSGNGCSGKCTQKTSSTQ